MRSGDDRRWFVDLRTTSVGPDGAPVPDWPVVTFDVDGAAGTARSPGQRGGAGPGPGPRAGSSRPPGPGRRRSSRRRSSASRSCTGGGSSTSTTARSAGAPRAPGSTMPTRSPPTTRAGLPARRQRAGRLWWYSAMRRSATYLVDGEPIQAEPVEEGHIAAGAVVRGTDNAPADRWRRGPGGTGPGWRAGAAAGHDPRAARGGAARRHALRLVWHHDVAPDEPAGWRPLRFSLGYQSGPGGRHRRRRPRGGRRQQRPLRDRRRDLPAARARAAAGDAAACGLPGPCRGRRCGRGRPRPAWPGGALTGW